ncbi:MAG: hypothetical protein D6761_13480 [Candidatus Dadabacteria bacterium]|nr:MAG: hypothetical protein D6761_13480 [Candidatus Dadabacteria bacterium]
MNDNHPSESTPTPSGTRRNIGRLLFAVMLFYLAVFAMIDMVGFQFPMSILLTFFLIVAVPLGLVAAGIVHVSALIRAQLGGTVRPPQAATLMSLFVATTVIVMIGFVSVYPEWRRAAIESWQEAIRDSAVPDIPDAQVDALARDVGRVAESFTGFLESGSTDPIDEHPELVAAFQAVVSAVTDGTLTVEEFERLRRLVPEAPAGATAPGTTTAPAAVTSEPGQSP